MCILHSLRIAACLLVQAGLERRDAEIQRLGVQLEGIDRSDQALMLQRAETHENIILQLHQQVHHRSALSQVARLEWRLCSSS